VYRAFILPRKEFMGQAEQQLEMLHGNKRGYIAICQDGEEGFKQKVFCYDEAVGEIQRLIGQQNVYISQNIFRERFRNNKLISEFHSVWSDLDYYKLPGLFAQTPEQILMWLETEYFKKSIPVPNYVLFSGRGLTISWIIDPVPPSEFPAWSLAQEYIYEQLKEMGADAKAKDPSRVTRVSDTINSKNGVETHMKVYSPNKYSLEEIIDYIPNEPDQIPEPANRPKKKNRKSRIAFILNERTLIYARMQDLVILQKLRKDCTGTRELMTFLYRYWASCFYTDTEQALNQTLDFNSDFTKPLSRKEVVKSTRSAEKAYNQKSRGNPNNRYGWNGYRYRNKTLIDILDISPDEQRHLKTIIGKEEKNRRLRMARMSRRRNENGFTKRQQDKKDRLEIIIELYKSNVNKKDIALKLNISVSTVKRFLKGVTK